MNKNTLQEKEEVVFDSELAQTKSESNKTTQSQEEALSEVDARVAEFSAAVIDPIARLSEMHVSGPEADILATEYTSITEKLRDALLTAGTQAKAMIGAGVLGTTIALSPNIAHAEEQPITSLEQSVEEFVQTEKADTQARLISTEEVHNMEKSVANDPSKEEAREAKEKEVVGKIITTAQEGGVPKVIEKHGGFIAEQIIPGAEIKQAATGKDSYGNELNKGERVKKFLIGVLHVATLGQSAVAQKILALITVGRSVQNFAEKQDVSHGADVVSSVAGAIPGMNTVKNTAEAISLATDPRLHEAVNTIQGASATTSTSSPENAPASEPEKISSTKSTKVDDRISNELF